MNSHTQPHRWTIWISLLVALLWAGHSIAGGMGEAIAAEFGDVEIELRLDAQDDPPVAAHAVPSTDLAIIVLPISFLPTTLSGGIDSASRPGIRAPPIHTYR